MKTLFLPNFTFLCTCLIVTGLFQLQVAEAQNLLDPKKQTKFVNPLPIPSVIDGRNGGTFTVSISQFLQDLGLRNRG